MLLYLCVHLCRKSPWVFLICCWLMVKVRRVKFKYFQDYKNYRKSADDIQKFKDNNNQEKFKCSMKRFNEDSKCNIQKQSKMLETCPSPPIITHTAATPQDSPNTTLETGYRDCRAIYPSALSFESIDRTPVRYQKLTKIFHFWYYSVHYLKINFCNRVSAAFILNTLNPRRTKITISSIKQLESSAWLPHPSILQIRPNLCLRGLYDTFSSKTS